MLRVLIVDDNKQDRFLLRTNLPSRFAQEAEFIEAENLKAAGAILQHRAVDIITLDLDLNTGDTPDQTYAKMRELAPDIPIVILSGIEDREQALRLIAQGAEEYIVKGTTKPRQIYEILVNTALRSRHTVRLKNEEAEVVKKMRHASDGMIKAYRGKASNETREMRQVEMLAANTDLSALMLSKLEQISRDQQRFEDKSERRAESRDEKLSELSEEVSVLSEKINTLHSDFKELKGTVSKIEEDVEEHERDSLIMEAVAEVKETKDKYKEDTKRFKLDLHTKILIAALGLLGTTSPLWMKPLISAIKILFGGNSD